MLKSVIKGAVALSVCVSSLSAFAGGDIGNGGGAIVCRNEAGEVQQAWLLDLWEAENLPLASNGMQPLRIVRDDVRTVEQQIWSAIRKLEEFDPVPADRIRPYVEQVRRVMSVLPVQMRRIEDSNDFATPRISGLNCQREQLANFTDSYGLIVSQDIYEKLSKTDQAALILHEAIYKLDREQRRDQISSDATRMIVGYLFSDAPLKREIFTREMLLRCKTYSTQSQVLSGGSNFGEFFIRFDVSGANQVGEKASSQGTIYLYEACRIDPNESVEWVVDLEWLLSIDITHRRMLRRRLQRRSFSGSGLFTLAHYRSESVLGRLQLQVNVPAGESCWEIGGAMCEFSDQERLIIPFGPGWDRLP